MENRWTSDPELERQSGLAGAGDYSAVPSDLRRLDDLDDWEIAEGEPDPRGWDLIGRDGESLGTIDTLLASPSTQRAYYAIVSSGGWLSDRKGSRAVPLAEIDFGREDGKAYAPYTQEEIWNAPEWREEAWDEMATREYWSGIAPAGRMTDERRPVTTGEAAAVPPGEVRVPLVEETAEVRRHTREAGHISVRKRVETDTQHVSTPVTRTRVVVEERDVPPEEARAVDAEAATLRPGETLNVPIVEEEATVETVPRVTREVVVHAEKETEQIEKDVPLRREVVDVVEEGEVEEEEETPRTPRR